MDYYYSKQHLDTFSDQELNLLTKYYDIYIDNRDDLLWLLSVAILSSHMYVQMPPNRAWERYKDQLLKKFAIDRSATKNVDKLPIEIINADPLSTKKYLEWIIKSYIDNGIKLFEDMGRVKTALLEYGYLLKKKLITNKFEQNIHAFCGLAGCQQGKRTRKGLDEFLDQYNTELKEMRRVSEIKIAKKDVEKVYEDEDLMIITPLTQEASCKYGAGTKWCTAARESNVFEYYSSQGPLYILIPKKPRYDREKYQIHIESNSIMNEKDEHIEYKLLRDRFPSIRNIKVFVQLELILKLLSVINDTEAVMKILDTVTSIDLSNANIGESGMLVIIRALIKNNTIVNINLSNTGIGGLSIMMIADMLAKNTTLKSISLRENNIGIDIVAISSALEKNNTLLTIDLSENNIDSFGATMLANALKKNEALQNIYLHANSIGDTGVSKLSRALEENITLLNIDLSENNIGDSGVVELSRALEKNKTLRILDLSFNKISDTGATILANVLENENKFITIYMSFNNIGESGMTILENLAIANRVVI